MPFVGPQRIFTATLDTKYCNVYSIFMLPEPTRRFSLDALASEAARVLGAFATLPDDGRVSPTPDVRTLRYYQSLGLLDRPDNAHPRDAYYGYHQLLQVIATKALQRLGYALSDIQARLTGRSTAELEAAVRPALGLASAPAAPPSPARPQALHTYTVAPGLLLTVDPARFDAEALLRHLHLFPGVRP